jgi:hypothetical protein
MNAQRTDGASSGVGAGVPACRLWKGVSGVEMPPIGRQGRLPPRNLSKPAEATLPYLLPLRPRRLPVRLASGPGRCSAFFDPKVRGNPRPIVTRRGKSGHHRAGCRASFTASAGGMRQGMLTDSVTENRPPLERRGTRAGGGGAIPRPATLSLDPPPARVKRWGKSPPRPA